MKKITILMAFFAGFMLVIGLFMLMNGSLEAFPTDEQIEKVRIAGGVLAVLGLAIECAALIIFSKLKREK